MTDAIETRIREHYCADNGEWLVEKRGEGKWCVSAFGGTVVDRNLNRHYEPMPSSRTEEFIAATRFTLDEAFDIAKRYNEHGL